MKLALFSCALSALALGHATAANLVTNGSFEAPSITSGSYQIGGITGWYSTIGDGGEIQNYAAGTPFDGAQLLELDGNQNSNLLQDIQILQPGVYNLSFEYSPRPGISADSNPVEIYFQGNLLDTLTGVGAANTVWSSHNYQVIAAVGFSTLEFRAIGVSDSLGGYIDDVSLAAPVPEASSGLALLALGLMFSKECVANRKRKQALKNA